MDCSSSFACAQQKSAITDCVPPELHHIGHSQRRVAEHEHKRKYALAVVIAERILDWVFVDRFQNGFVLRGRIGDNRSIGYLGFLDLSSGIRVAPALIVTKGEKGPQPLNLLANRKSAVCEIANISLHGRKV